MTTGTGVLRSELAGRLAALESRSWGSLLLGIALAAALIGAMLLWWAAFGLWSSLFDAREPLGISFDGRNHVAICILIAFIVPGLRWARRGEQRDLERVRPLTTLEPTELSHAHSSLTFRVFALLGGLVLGTLILLLTRGDPAASLWLYAQDPHLVWSVAANLVLFAAMIHAARRTILGLRLLERVSSAIRTLDLLDSTQLAPFGRIGLRPAFLWLGGSTIASALGIGMRRVWPLVAVISVTLLCATLSFTRPAQIIRRRIREAKRLELERVRGRIESAREGALSGDPERAPGHAALLPGLLAYEARIEAVNEWPFDTPTLMRFAALAIIATGSWVGGALVERFLGAVLD